MDFADKIAKIKTAPTGKRGSLFEALVKKTLAKRFERIEMWSEYAAKHSRHTTHDIRIDLVAYDSAGTKHAV